MKILFTTHQGGLAGSTFSIIYLAKGLAQKGHEIHVGCPCTSKLYASLDKEAGITCHDIPFASYFDLRSSREVARLARVFNAEIVCAQGGRDRNLTIVAKWLFGMEGDLVFVRRQRPRDEPWIKRFIHTRATRCIVMVSHGLKEIFLNKGYSYDHLPVIHNGVSFEEFSPPVSLTDTAALKAKLGICDERVIGCVSRRKYQEVVIRSLKWLPKDLIVLFIGIEENQLSAVLEQENPIQRLIFIKEANREDLPQYYDLMTLSILASQMDGFGLVLVESMLRGIPVVASNFGGIRDVIIEDKSGYLFDNDRPDELADKVIRLLENPELTSQIALSAQAFARENFDINDTVNNYENLFSDLLLDP